MAEPGGGGHQRRKRYRGSHPRAFSEKYKEHNPERYKDDIEKILARGDTPAGSHRSIAVAEILAVLEPRPGESAVDATLGYGGHAREILAALSPGGRLYGFDRDGQELGRTEARLRALGYGPASFVPVHANFSAIPAWLAASGQGGVDVFLADLGLSSMQIDDPLRGFSFKRKGPLDMRMDGAEGPTARDYLAGVSEARLGAILVANADEAQSAQIAHAICLRRGRLETTRDLAEAMASAFPDLEWGDPSLVRTLRRCFQAIRIEVNGEFDSLDALLQGLPSCLKPGGRAAILSFHSGEDRRVEESFRAGLEAGLYSSASAGPTRPTQAERYANPRSSAAKLRWAIRA